MIRSATIHSAAIDLGATSGRVIVGTWSGPSLTIREVHRFPNAFSSLAGHDYWELGALWNQIQTGLTAAAAALPDGETLASVGVDTWGVDHVLLDATGRLVFPSHAYRDARTQPGLARLTSDPKAEARLYAATGIPALFYNTSLQLAESIAAYPSLRRVVKRCLFLSDYFNYLLSGRMENEVSIASTSQLLAVSREPDWSVEALRYTRVPGSWFSRPIYAGTSLGQVRGLDGFTCTKVVVVPGHDTACAFDAMPVAEDGSDLCISSGTWSLAGFESNVPLLGAEALAAGISNERTGDGNYRPLKTVVGLWLLECVLREFAARPTDSAGWENLIDAAEAAPASATLLNVSDSAFINPPSMCAVIDDQLRERNASRPGNVAGYVRLVCASLGHGHAAALDQFEKISGRTFKRILLIGGGAKNRLLCQFTANAAKRPLVACELEGTATGNLARQFISLGVVENRFSFRAQLLPTIQTRTYAPRSNCGN